MSRAGQDPGLGLSQEALHGAGAVTHAAVGHRSPCRAQPAAPAVTPGAHGGGGPPTAGLSFPSRPQ